MDDIEDLIKQLEAAKSRRTDAEQRKDQIEKELGAIDAEITQKKKDLLARGKDAEKAAKR